MDTPELTAPPAPSESDLIGQVQKAWAEVLDVDDAASIPLDANFLEVGGSSLLLIMLWEQLDAIGSRSLKVSDLFRHSTVRAQAALLSGEDQPSAPTPRRVRDRGGVLDRARRNHRGSASDVE